MIAALLGPRLVAIIVKEFWAVLRDPRARLSLILRAKAIGSSLAEIKHYLDLYGTHGEGRTVQMKYVLDKTTKAIAELEQKRAHIDASLAELRIINATVKRGLGK